MLISPQLIAFSLAASTMASMKVNRTANTSKKMSTREPLRAATKTEAKPRITVSHAHTEVNMEKLMAMAADEAECTLLAMTLPRRAVVIRANRKPSPRRAIVMILPAILGRRRSESVVIYKKKREMLDKLDLLQTIL